MKVGLVLEGGAMRGMYTAGILDVFMDNNIEVDAIIGTSAGALFGINYFSKQKGRTIRYNKKYCKDFRYISIPSLLFTGNVVNKKFGYYKMSYKLDPFDNDAFIKTKKDFYATVTNIETGCCEYVKITDPIKQMEYLRASSSMPIASKIVKIDGKKYLDGGVTDSIPFNKFINLGYDKIIVVLTQPIDYKKEELCRKTVKYLKIRYRKYPIFVNKLLNRHNDYNNDLENLKELEKSGRVFVIRPSKVLDIKVTENDPNKYDEVYNLGVNNAKSIIKDLKKYLKR